MSKMYWLCQTTEYNVAVQNSNADQNPKLIGTFHSLMVLSFVESRNRAPLAVWHHLILLIFSSISKLFK
jgi:hypothetical protein